MVYADYGKRDQIALLKSYLGMCLARWEGFLLGDVKAVDATNMKYAAEIFSPGQARACLEVRQGLLDDAVKGQRSKLHTLVDNFVREKFPDESNR